MLILNKYLLISPLVNFPGETGETVETEMESEKVGEAAETKEEETGEVMDLSAAPQIGQDGRVKGHSML